MARIFKEKTGHKKINRKAEGRLIDFPSFTKELKIVYLNEEIETNRMEKYEREKKFFLEKTEYIPVENWEDVLKLWTPSYSKFYLQFQQKKVMFLIWKYSGMNILVETNEQSDFLEKIKDEDKTAVKNYALSTTAYPQNYIIDEFGAVNLTKNGQITKKHPETGNPLWQPVAKGDPTFAIYERLRFSHLPFSYVKKALEFLDSKKKGDNSKIREEAERLAELKFQEKMREFKEKSNNNYKAKELSIFLKERGFSYSGTKEEMMRIIKDNSLEEELKKTYK